MYKLEIVKKVNEILEQHGKDVFPVDVAEICKKHSIQIFRRDLQEIELKAKRKISGFIYVNKAKDESPNKERCIFINENDPETRQNFTLAHELGHFFLHMQNDSDGVIISFRGDRNPIEREADIFASELLMPKELVEREYRKIPFPTVSYLASEFGVSKEAMRYRLEEMGLDYIGR